MFIIVRPGIAKSLYADGALWKRARNLPYVKECIQKAVKDV